VWRGKFLPRLPARPHALPQPNSRLVPVRGAAVEPTLSGGAQGLGSDVAIVHLAEAVTDVAPLPVAALTDELTLFRSVWASSSRTALSSARSYEGKGLDWVLEVHVGGDRKKDAELNVARYARLGIPEYFLYDRARNCLSVYRLASREATSYTAIFPNQGLYESGVLGLDAQVEQDRLRFYAGTAPLLESEELVALIHAMADDSLPRAGEAERRRAEAARLRAEAERRRDEAAQEVARLRAELERLKR